MHDLHDAGKAKRSDEIGRTIATEKFPSTADGFWISLDPDAVISPFDFVTVRHARGTRTIGLVKELLAIGSTGVLARVVVMANTDAANPHGSRAISEMPVPGGLTARFSREKEVTLALGIPDMASPIPSAVIEMANGLKVPVSLDTSYLLGPDTAHVNAAGISGNNKTTYLMFLLQSTFQTLGSERSNGVAMIIFNTKEQDLLHIDEKRRSKRRSKKLFDLLDLDIEPFDNVTYYLPRGPDGEPNSAFVPENSKTYSYGLEDVYDRLELLFDIHDGHDISSILNYISEAWPLRSAKGTVRTWKDLQSFTAFPLGIVAHKSTELRFLGSIQRVRRSPLFTDGKVRSTYLGQEILALRGGDVFVVDIAMLPTVEEQAFVVGDVMKSIDDLYSARSRGARSRPRYVLIFIDEINRFSPKRQPGAPRSAVSDQIMRTVISGRSRGTILFSAQQFKSTVSPVLHENIGMHVIAKLGASELATEAYGMLDDSTKKAIARLNKGEMVMVHPAFRHPIKVVFPKPPVKV